MARLQLRRPLHKPAGGQDAEKRSGATAMTPFHWAGLAFLVGGELAFLLAPGPIARLLASMGDTRAQQPGMSTFIRIGGAVMLLLGLGSAILIFA
jgi:hypothetical protein